MFDLINNAICIGFPVGFAVLLLLVCRFSDQDQYVERDWSVG